MAHREIGVWWIRVKWISVSRQIERNMTALQIFLFTLKPPYIYIFTYSTVPSAQTVHTPPSQRLIFMIIGIRWMRNKGALKKLVPKQPLVLQLKLEFFRHLQEIIF